MQTGSHATVGGSVQRLAIVTHRSRRRPRLLGPVVLACAVVGALLAQTGVASAVSRGFDIYNATGLTTPAQTLRLESVKKIKAGCNKLPDRCAPSFYLFGFEGRPHDGAELRPTPPPFLAVPQRFELQWYLGNIYAAAVTYKIEGTNAQLEITIKNQGTFPDGSYSTCRIVPAPPASRFDAPSCSAGYQTIVYR
jgi:hypothetical protein